MRNLCCTLALLFLSGEAGLAQEQASPKWEVGDKAPVFTGTDSGGNKVALADLLKKHEFVALVFVRSGDW